jgi:tRNA-binding protein
MPHFPLRLGGALGNLRKDSILEIISWNDFEQIELRVGTILTVEDFPEAKQPAYIIKADFGQEIGVKKTSARVVNLYSKEQLSGRQIIGVINFAPKQIGPVKSDFLLTGFYRSDGSVVLAVPDKEVSNGSKMS